MRTIALFLPNWIGDVVMATPAVRAIRTAFPNDRLLAVVTPYVAATLDGSPCFDRTIAFEKRSFWTTVMALRAEGAESAVLFSNSFRTALLAHLGGCRRVVGFARYFRDFLLSERLYPARGRSGRYKPTPAIDDYNRLAV